MVKGSLFAKGQAWEGPWVEANGNGPITIAVPTPDSEGVVPKEAPPIMVVGADGKVVREGVPARTRDVPATRQTTVAGYSADTSSAPAKPADAGAGAARPEASSRSGPSNGGDSSGKDEAGAGFRELEVTAWHA